MKQYRQWSIKTISVLLSLAIFLNLTASFYIFQTNTTLAAGYATPSLISYASQSVANNVIMTAGSPEGVQPGDLLVFCVMTDKDLDGSTVKNLGWPSGFEIISNRRTTTGDDMQSMVGYKIATSSDPQSYDFTYDDTDGASYSVILAGFRGVDVSDPVDATSTSLTDGAGWSDSIDANPGVTTSNDNALVVLCAHHSDGAISNYTAPAGTTLVDDRTNVTDARSAMAYFVQGSAGSTESRQFTTTGENGGEEWHLNTVAFNAAAITNTKTKKEFSSATSTTWTVPENVYEIEVKAWGAGGGGGGSESDHVDPVGGTGGGGAFVYGRMEVTPGESLGIEVGEGGGTGVARANSGGAGGGGGHTEMTRNGNVLVIAGAGGGGGGSAEDDTDEGGNGGAGGANTGQSGTIGSAGGSDGGSGGTQGGGGAAGGNGVAGSSQAGGNGEDWNGTTGGELNGGAVSGGDGGDSSASDDIGGAGGGGSGYFGGGGGGSPNSSSQSGGGGGGGSSWASTTAVSGIVKYGGNYRSPGNPIDPDLKHSSNSNAGLGGHGDDRNGEAGFISGEGDESAEAGEDGMLIIKYRVLGETSGQTRFTSDVFITGNAQVAEQIAKSSGTFVIDHPLDPKNKMLYHSFVESPEAKNIYDGIAKFNWRGEATVRLPDYFEALNIDYRYQFTPMGAPMPGLYVKEEINRNRFVIAGGVRGERVTWQVTGIRNDPYIQAHPIIPEVEKGPDQLVDKGKFLFSGYEEIVDDNAE